MLPCTKATSTFPFTRDFTLNAVPNCCIKIPWVSTLNGCNESFAISKKASPFNSTVRSFIPLKLTGYFNSDKEFKCTLVPSDKVNRNSPPRGTDKVFCWLISTFDVSGIW